MTFLTCVISLRLNTKFRYTFRGQSTDPANATGSYPSIHYLHRYTLHYPCSSSFLYPTPYARRAFPTTFLILVHYAMQHCFLLFLASFPLGTKSLLTCNCAPVVISSKRVQCNDLHTSKNNRFENPTLTFKRRIKSHLPFSGIIRSSPYSPR